MGNSKASICEHVISVLWDLWSLLAIDWYKFLLQRIKNIIKTNDIIIVVIFTLTGGLHVFPETCPSQHTWTASSRLA
jgi:hypothetical protein